jgi:5'-deoxynucleotidase YfbR-like HD superfamily hydrolase
MQTISPAILHELWKTINDVPASEIAHLDDADLVNWLAEEFDRDRAVPTKELNALRKYLESRLQLIRDLTLG